jgi:hypothetical protein
VFALLCRAVQMIASFPQTNPGLFAAALGDVFGTTV